MFINLNYSLSIILHLLVVCCLIFIFKIEKQTNIYNDVININLKTLKTFKTKEIVKEKNFIDIKKDKEIKKEVNKNTETITEIKTPTKEIKKIDKNKNVYKFEEQKHEKNKRSNFSFFIGRIFSIYHKNQKKPFLYPSIKEKIKFSKKNEIFVENANSVRDFLDAERVINIIYKVYKKKITGVFNIGSGKGMSVKKFIKKEINSNINIISNNRINSLVSNNNKLKRKINANKI